MMDGRREGREGREERGGRGRRGEKREVEVVLSEDSKMRVDKTITGRLIERKEGGVVGEVTVCGCGR